MIAHCNKQEAEKSTHASAGLARRTIGKANFAHILSSATHHHSSPLCFVSSATVSLRVSLLSFMLGSPLLSNVSPRDSGDDTGKRQRVQYWCNNEITITNCQFDYKITCNTILWRPRFNRRANGEGDTFNIGQNRLE